MPRAIAAALLLLTAACQPVYIGMSPLDSLEARLSLTPAQRPAWQAFRREAQRTQARWSAPDAPGRAELHSALMAPAFDRSQAQQAAALAARQGYEDAQRLIESWSRVDALLTDAQRQEVRRSPPF